MMDDSRFIERRKFIRIPARFVVMMKLDINNLSDYAIDTEIINISEGGMLLELRETELHEPSSSAHPVSIYYHNLQLDGQLIWLQFRLPGNPQVIQAIAKPVWKKISIDSNGAIFHLGIQYTHILPEAQQAISQYITWQLQQGS
ncbi:MAG: PilZ domain-containing protein [bacterium]|nr:PilZ domain-containing protein [bacterium]